MSLKDLFESTKTTQSSSADKVAYEAESEAYVEAYIADKDTFVPSVDFSTASNFARYGSAEKYYVDSIERITNTYPYDGSRAEKVEFQKCRDQISIMGIRKCRFLKISRANIDCGN